MQIKVKHERQVVLIDRQVFSALFEHSVVHDRADVVNALQEGEITYRTLVKVARIAEIPYPLFFAPLAVVEEQLRLKTEKLMAGFSKRSEFFMHSRHEVHLPDVELIVKDLLRKQQLIRTDKTLEKCAIVGLLKKSGATTADDATKLMAALDLDPHDLRNAKSKEKAFEVLVGKLEAKHILVSQSVKKYMPQTLPAKAKFSGMTVKDNKVPYVFIPSGDEGEKYEPAGRRVFTLTLLAVMVACNRFAAMTYTGHTDDDIGYREYLLTEEILMPTGDFKRANFDSLDAVKEVGEVFKVTPSAVVMRARRLGRLTKDQAHAYLAELQSAYRKPEPHHRNQMLTVNALKKYNGMECSRRMLALLDAGGISHGDFCRVMFSNHLRTRRQVTDFRVAIG